MYDHDQNDHFERKKLMSCRVVSEKTRPTTTRSPFWSWSVPTLALISYSKISCYCCVENSSTKTSYIPLKISLSPNLIRQFEQKYVLKCEANDKFFSAKQSNANSLRVWIPGEIASYVRSEGPDFKFLSVSSKTGDFWVITLFVEDLYLRRQTAL